MPRWVGDVLEAIFIIGLGAIVFAIFYLLFTGGRRGSSALDDSDSLAGRIKSYADDVAASAENDAKNVANITVAPRLVSGFNNVASFLLK